MQGEISQIKRRIADILNEEQEVNRAMKEALDAENISGADSDTQR